MGVLHAHVPTLSTPGAGGAAETGHPLSVGGAVRSRWYGNIVGGSIWKDAPTMPMRENCKYYESRSYPNGETVRKCDLDLAPEAPWRCPENCEAFTPRLADINWKHGSLITPPTPEAPKSVGEDPSIAALLDAAEDIVNEAGPRIRSEVDADREKAARPKRWKFWKR